MKMWPSSSHSHVIPFTIVLEKFAWSAQSFHHRGRRGLALCASKRWSFELAALRQATTKNLKSLARFRQLASNFCFNLLGRSKKTQVGVKPFLIPIRLRLPVLGQENYVRCAVCAESSQLSSQSCCFFLVFLPFCQLFCLSHDVDSSFPFDHHSFSRSVPLAGLSSTPSRQHSEALLSCVIFISSSFLYLLIFAVLLLITLSSRDLEVLFKPEIPAL